MSGYDLFSPQFKADPFATYAEMRQNAPVYGHKTPKGEIIWYITRYDDVMTVLKDTERFVKDRRNIFPQDKPAQTPAIHQAINHNMLFADPPDHTRLRGLVNLAFTSRRVAQLEPYIQMMADSLLDAFEGKAQFDLISAYAQPLPLHVIAELLGLPPVDRAQVFEWSQAIVSPGRHNLSFKMRKRQVRDLVAYLKHIFAQRRDAPQDDLISALVEAEMAGDSLSEMELSSMVALLFVTGHETVVNLIGNGVLALLQHPAQLQALRENPALLEGAIEELLRYDSPVETSTARWASRDITFHGQHIKKGELVRVVIAGANRDTACCTHPNQLNITRADNKHIAFGHGIHYCLGAPLARLQGKIALETLLRRCPNLSLALPAQELTWQPGVLLHALKSLPVRP